MTQNKLINEEKKDEFVNSLNLTPKKIKEDLESVKSIEGFPKGEDDDLIEISSPPYYTAYPNPYISEFIQKQGKSYDPEKDCYKKEPFVGDVAAGKHHPIYGAHTYHTKVPHEAIIEYINHYTNPGDIILDGFCGSGMAGVAAKLSKRRAIISDLAPMATFIASNCTNPIDINSFNNEFLSLIKKAEDICGWLYATKHTNGKFGKINYVVWSDILSCPFCQHDLIIGERDDLDKPGSFSEKIVCSNCHTELNKRNIKRKVFKVFDDILKREVEVVKQKPILISYKYENKRYNKIPDEFDVELINKINSTSVPYWFPLNEMPEGHNTEQPKRSHNITYVYQYYTRRNLYVLSVLKDLLKNQPKYWFFISALLQKASRQMSLNEDYIGRVTKGVLYISQITQEINIFYYLDIQETKNLEFLNELGKYKDEVLVSTQSTTDLRNIPSNSIDYIFTDPPFGENIMYSELNYIWESWLKVFTNNSAEAIINKVQNKDLEEYRELMIKSMQSYFRVLKPNRWITVEFHNSKAQIWKTIQESIIKAGFIIGQVAVLDKKIGSFKQVTSAGSVKNDLVINAYKPSESFTNNFLKKAGLNLEKDFLLMHLEKLPVEPNVERTQQMLYSKLLAQYIQNGFEVRMDASEFYGLLRNNFIERDGFWFNKEQIPEYEKRVKLKKSIGKFNLDQTVLGIDSEKTAIIWLAQFLRTPKTYDEIYIDFSKNLMTSEDKMPELKAMLEENFTTEDGKYRLPSIAEKKEKEDMRDKRLNKEFQEIMQQAQSGKKITEVRKEALLHGLMKLYNERNVDLIKTLGNKLDKKIIESDDEIYAIVDWASAKEE